ncbi:hydrolase [Streptomyces sp. NPDC006553]|uniref:hydrolase n=1 Tax=unclassified Streptomyces TaxID=2593676 RepID=UPI00224E9CBC|nr:hydrolase [Streptomyces sp. NBC_00233]MCX5227932.1 hydrolase [Streptomyces sp. NBC_00233]
MEPIVTALPAEFWTARYDGSRFPGAAAVAARPGLAAGANCQLFAYEVLRHFGLTPPDLRSSELWSDTGATVHVPHAQPLDLVLFNSTADAYGAHVGVHVGDDAILHLCAEVGHPVVWGTADFASRERYAVRLGAKRVLPRSTGGAPINTSTGTR